MNIDAVIGCDAVDVSDAWLRLHTASGALRTIPWDSIDIAGLGGNHEGHVTIQGVTEMVTPFFATHDSLWIAYADGGFAQIMIEKSNPKRDQILSTFERQLEKRWRGDDLTSGDLTDQLFKMPVKLSGGMPKTMIVMIGVMLLLAILAVVVLLAKHSS